MHARFGLAYARARSKHIQTLSATLEYFIFILMTKLSDHSFYDKRPVHARFGLARIRARSKHFLTLRATLEWIPLHFLF